MSTHSKTKSTLNIKVVQTKSDIGDFKSQTKKIVSLSNSAFADGIDLLVFPEGSLSGYPFFDLLELQGLFKNQNQWIKQISNSIDPAMHIIIGSILLRNSPLGRPYTNAALYFHNRKFQIIPKTLLPTWDIFNEARWFEPSVNIKSNIIKINSYHVLVTICEDIWAWPSKSNKSIYSTNPLTKIKQKVDLIVNLSASPFTTSKVKQRHYFASKTATHFKAPLIYCNRVGAEDELVFDGNSFLISPLSKILFSAPSFIESSFSFEFPSLKVNKASKNVTQNHSQKKLTSTSSQILQVKNALVVGISEYCRKNNFQNIHLGLSGGIDSSVVAALATEALGPSHVTGISLSTQFTQSLSVTLAQELANNLNINHHIWPIQSLFQTIKSFIDPLLKIDNFSLVHENIQSRIRSLILMAFSNHNNSLLLATSNKSEIATGYGTLYGDLSGGLMPIGDLTKTQVYQLANYYHKHTGWITNDMITRPPTAELRENQTDQDSLPLYELLDKAINKIISDSPTRALNTKDELFVLSKLFNNEFKRWQSPPIIKINSRSFGRGRHWPLSHSCKPLLSGEVSSID